MAPNDRRPTRRQASPPRAKVWPEKISIAEPLRCGLGVLKGSPSRPGGEPASSKSAIRGIREG